MASLQDSWPVEKRGLHVPPLSDLVSGDLVLRMQLCSPKECMLYSFFTGEGSNCQP